MPLCVYLLHEKTTAYYRDRSHNGYGMIIAKNALASLRDRFEKYPDFLFMPLQPSPIPITRVFARMHSCMCTHEHVRAYVRVRVHACV